MLDLWGFLFCVWENFGFLFVFRINGVRERVRRFSWGEAVKLIIYFF